MVKVSLILAEASLIVSEIQIEIPGHPHAHFTTLYLLFTTLQCSMAPGYVKVQVKIKILKSLYTKVGQPL